MTVRVFTGGAALQVVDTFVPAPPQTIASFSASPASITAGQSTTLSWATSNALAVTLNGVPVAASGSVVKSPGLNAAYTLVVSGSAPDVTAVVPVAVQPLPTGSLVPLLGNSSLHQQQNWMADYADASKVVPRAVPWTLPAVVTPMGGVKAARYRMWHTFGQEQGLYSRLPAFDSTGLSAPWSPQVGDQFKAIVDDLNANPPPDGPRGIGILSPYGTAIDHPFALPNGTLIPRAPTWLWLEHNARMRLVYCDNGVKIVSAGKIPNITHAHDWCVDESNRLTFYVASLGTPDSGGHFTGSSIKKVDRTAGAGTAAGPEDASKYVVTDFLTGGSYLTGVATDESSNVYSVDFGTGKVYKNQTVFATIPKAFGIRYNAGKVYVLTAAIEVFPIDCVTGLIGANLFAAVSGGTFNPGDAFVTISIDRNGTFDTVGNISVSRSHGAGNLDVWIYSTVDGTVKEWNTRYGGGIGYMKCGDFIYCMEWAAHYPWTWNYHRWQGRVLTGGFTSPPHELVAYKTAAEVPAEESEPDANTNGYRLAALAQQVILKGGSYASPFNKPSFTCLMTREGWSLFAGCSSDEIALMAFDAAEAWIRQGMIGSFRRDDLLPIEMYALLVFFYRGSQRFLLQGGALMASLKSWWIGKYGAIPAIPSNPGYTPEPAQQIVARLQGGVWKAVIVEGGYDTTKVPPAYTILADEGTANQVTMPATLTGVHALTVKATGPAPCAVVARF